jgi:lipid-A-disaccharide synthase-like uncharacterized protein
MVETKRESRKPVLFFYLSFFSEKVFLYFGISKKNAVVQSSLEEKEIMSQNRKEHDT